MNAITLDLPMLSIGLLLVRLIIGCMMTAHGAQKLLGWFGGSGMQQTREFMVQLGFPKGGLFATAAALGEMTSGVLVAIGFLGPVGPALMIAVLLVAMLSVHWHNGLWAMKNGVELPLVYATSALGLALTGFGWFSVDALLGIGDWFDTKPTLMILAIGVVGGIASAAMRQKATV